jgi:hypothetical protein
MNRFPRRHLICQNHKQRQGRQRHLPSSSSSSSPIKEMGQQGEQQRLLVAVALSRRIQLMSAHQHQLLQQQTLLRTSLHPWTQMQKPLHLNKVLQLYSLDQQLSQQRRQRLQDRQAVQGCGHLAVMER